MRLKVSENPEHTILMNLQQTHMLLLIVTVLNITAFHWVCICTLHYNNKVKSNLVKLVMRVESKCTAKGVSSTRLTLL